MSSRDRARLARFFGSTPQGHPLKYLERAAVRPPVRLVEDAPVQKNRFTGDDVRLTHLPVVTHNEKDAGPYLTSGAVILKDPETGIVNGAIQRMQLKATAASASSWSPTATTPRSSRNIKRKAGTPPAPSS